MFNWLRYIFGVNKKEDSKLVEAIASVACELRQCREQNKIEFEWHKSHFGLATKYDLEKLGDKIMSAIGDWGAKVAPKLTKIQTGVDKLQALVETLQNSPGAITPEDQATLDQIDAAVDAIGTDADSIPTPPPV